MVELLDAISDAPAHGHSERSRELVSVTLVVKGSLRQPEPCRSLLEREQWLPKCHSALIQGAMARETSLKPSVLVILANVTTEGT